MLCIDYLYLQNDTENLDYNSWTWNIATRLMEREVPIGAVSCYVLRQTLIDLSSGRTGEGDWSICCGNGDCIFA